MPFRAGGWWAGDYGSGDYYTGKWWAAVDTAPQIVPTGGGAPARRQFVPVPVIARVATLQLVQVLRAAGVITAPVFVVAETEQGRQVLTVAGGVFRPLTPEERELVELLLMDGL